MKNHAMSNNSVRCALIKSGHIKETGFTMTARKRDGKESQAAAIAARQAERKYDVKRTMRALWQE
jgi:hypothetical protein